MPIDKIIPRKLNTDIDGKLIDKASMIDALNLYSSSDEGGNIGVLKNVKGNTKIEQSTPFGSDSRVLGSVLDQKTNICYFFVSSSSGPDHGIWAYDPEDKLSGNRSVPSVRLIYKSKQFNFPSTGFVKGDVVHINKQTFPDAHGDEFDKDAVIFFTDNKNEPRKVNAYRAYEAQSNIYGNSYAEADFITACPKVPLDSISFSFTKDDNRKVSNFKGTSGFQFAYQHIYIDGFESSVSVYSDVAFPPSVIQQGALTYGSHDSYNLCNLIIPKPGPEIEFIKILAREGEGSSFLEIEEIKRSDLFGANDEYVGVYPFYNDKLAKAFPESDIDKQFDSVPRKAKSQTVAENRLMYGNYFDGFDSVNVECQGQVIYRQRPLDSVDFTVTSNSFIGIHEEQPVNSSGAKRKSVGFTIDTSSLPDSVPPGASISLNINMTPDRNWHIYNSDESYHQSSLVGEYDQSLPVTFNYNEYNNNSSNYTVQNPSDSGASYLRGDGADGKVLLFSGNNSGIIDDDGPGLKWKRKYNPASGNTINEPEQARIGTSAANPIILRGGSLVFNVGFTLSQEIPSGFDGVTATTIKEILTGVEYSELTYKEFISEGSIVQNRTSTLNHSLPISNHTIIPQAYIGQSSTTADLSRMIMAVLEAGASSDLASCPIGYVIFKEATAKFGISSVDDEDTGVENSTKKAFRLSLLSLTDVKPMTCYKNLEISTGESVSSEFFLNSWGVLDPSVEFLDEEGNVTDFNLDDHMLHYGNDIDANTLNLNAETADSNVTLGAGFGYRKIIGYLTPSTESKFDILSEGDQNSGGIACIFDGKGGPGGGPSRGSGGNTYDDYRLDQQGSIPFCTPFVKDINSLKTTIHNRSIWEDLSQGEWTTQVTHKVSPMFSGRIGLTAYSSLPLGAISGGNDYRPSVLPLLQNRGPVGSYELGYITKNTIQYPVPFEDDDIPGALNPFSVNFSYHQFIVPSSLNVSGSYSGDVFRSFKSNANHDFGIVYYDERGRHGFVNYLTNVFVPGLSSQDRPEGSQGGPSSIALSIQHEPPAWAHYFKIVYGGNSTTDNFIQYSVPNAYVRRFSEDVESTERNNLYVSLNYLQGNEISYTSAFGAKNVAGGLNMYNYKEGDKLRVISYGQEDSRIYPPSSYEFDVIDLIDLAAPQEGEEYSVILNDLEAESTSSISSRTQGQFLVLRDNPEATGLSYQSVSSGSSSWSENCIVEIYSPSKNMEEEEKFYYEMGNTYRVATLGGNLVHSPSTIVLNKGDVWFRKVALNLKKIQDSAFVDLIPSDNVSNLGAASNFESIFLESSTATDLNRGDFKGFGRPNVIGKSAKESRREASITYSDKSNPESSRPRFTSFNINSINYNDYDYNQGEINYISTSSGYLTLMQDSRISLIPLSKNVISDASGGSNIIASNVVLGEAIPQDGFKGCDSAESVVVNDDTIYYANKRHGDVYTYSRSQGLRNISDGAIESAISSEIKRISGDTGSLKMIGGYDPLKDEYLLTVIRLNEVDTSDFEIVSQPSPGTDVAITGPIVEPDFEDGLNVTGFQVFVDTDGDGIIGLNEFLQQGDIATDISILNPGQVAVTASFDGLEGLAGQINTTDQNEINQALFNVGQNINLLVDETTSTLTPDDVLEGVVSEYIGSQGIDITSPAGVTAFIDAAGLSEANLSTGDGDGDGGTNDFNPLSNYDLAAQLILNDSDGWQVPSSMEGVNNQFSASEYRDVLRALGASAPLLSDLNLDGIVGTSDLLILLSAFGFPISADLVQALEEADAANIPPFDGGDVQSTDGEDNTDDQNGTA